MNFNLSQKMNYPYLNLKITKSVRWWQMIAFFTTFRHELSRLLLWACLKVLCEPS